METNTIPLNLSKICRICLCEGDEMFSIFSELYEEENCQQKLPCLYEIITNLSSMKILVDDNLPQIICVKCVKNAHTSHKFQTLCNRSQIILETYLKQYEIGCSDFEDESDVEIKSNDILNCTNENESNKDDSDLVLNENDLYLAENYIKESLRQEAQEIPNIHKGSELNPDEFFANVDVCLSRTPENENGLTSKTLEAKISKEVDDCLGNSEDESIGSLKNYEKVVPSGEKLYACKMCDRVYKNGSSLRGHIRGHHRKKIPYKCNICEKSFKMYGSFFYHKRMHTGEQPYCCKICGKKYKQSGSLTAHMRVHTGQRPFLCSICGRGFRQQPDLNYHMRTHTKEKPYQCNVCGKTMSMQSHLVQHMRIHTGERPFKCSQCEKAFPTSTCLKRHQSTHTGKKPHCCEVCQKSFSRRSSLNLHSKTHTDDRPYVCPVCHKGFIQAHSLKTHIATHSDTVKSTKEEVRPD
ncbi:hypothetical protein WA026_009164 [Henosepilachna vigintioctopunctata]|uniref:Uncharacterized protein n=1 Tax=Henosepilachna vigintioctopunctata TaxID=420089 RepID=A0AAW1UY34_9CUCU